MARAHIEEESVTTDFPLDDITYNLVTILHQKSKGLEAYEKYLQDAESNERVREVLERLQQQDMEAVAELRDCLADALNDAADDDEDGDEADDDAEDEEDDDEGGLAEAKAPQPEVTTGAKGPAGRRPRTSA